MSGAIVTQSGSIRRFQATIPNSATGAQVRSLVPTPEAGVEYLGFKILGVDPTGVQRALIQVASPRPGSAIAASDFTTHGQAVVTGADYYEPADLDLDSYVRAPAGAASAIFVVYVK